MWSKVMTTAVKQIKKILVYQGYGACEKDAAILLRKLQAFTDSSAHHVSYVTPEEIKEGALGSDVSLLAIGGGFDLGLIKSLGDKGMMDIREYVMRGGSYLGVCSGAYFACDYIEFDKGGPLEVVGERSLKFYPGTCVGPLYKRYVYNSHKGAVAAVVHYSGEMDGNNLGVMGERNESDLCVEKDTRGSVRENGIVPSVIGHNGGLSMCNGYGEKTSCVETTETKKGGAAENSETIKAQRKENVHASELIQNGVRLEQRIKRKYEADQGHERFSSKQSSIDDESVFIDKFHTRQQKFINIREAKDTGLAEQGCGAEFRVLLNGGGCFIDKDMKAFQGSANRKIPTPIANNSVMKKRRSELEEDHFETVTVLSRYLDLNSNPVAAVKCRCGDGLAVLSGFHFEYDAEDLDDGDEDVTDIIPHLKHSVQLRDNMFKSILRLLNV